MAGRVGFAPTLTWPSPFARQIGPFTILEPRVLKGWPRLAELGATRDPMQMSIELDREWGVEADHSAASTDWL